MKVPNTGGELLAALEERFQTSELEELAAACTIGRTTLENWRAKPGAPLRKPGRDHYRRIFGGAPAGPRAAPTATEAKLDRITELLEELIRSQGNARAPSPRRRKAGR